ncbi:MAG: site-specific DNA-methyltransferase [Candidatus Thermoplasmatota archaeon]|nr:site-specific DNA-methyltransferase [Candidatus Thermoplasmatota archaeon]MCL5790633.1 site-specific DNA-methyltransferase [Candidatus Thermoplasmatota archaeon]
MTANNRKKYISGLAQINFRVPFSYTHTEASEMYRKSEGVLGQQTDTINYEDCVSGMSRIPENSVDLIIADPPFGIGFNGKKSNYNRRGDLVRNGYVEARGSYGDFSEKWIGSIYRILKPSGSAYILSGWNNLGDILNSLSRSGLTLMNHIIWKYQFGVYTKRRFVTSHYHILFAVKDPGRYFFNRYEFYPQDVWEIRREYDRGKEKNGTKLPCDLVERMINFSSRPGDIVLDPFMGNGTTAICAKRLFRRYCGFEINREMMVLHESKLRSTLPGEAYCNLNDMRPSIEEIIKKYPHLKKILENGG